MCAGKLSQRVCDSADLATDRAIDLAGEIDLAMDRAIDLAGEFPMSIAPHLSPEVGACTHSAFRVVRYP